MLVQLTQRDHPGSKLTLEFQRALFKALVALQEHANALESSGGAAGFVDACGQLKSKLQLLRDLRLERNRA